MVDFTQYYRKMWLKFVYKSTQWRWVFYNWPNTIQHINQRKCAAQRFYNRYYFYLPNEFIWFFYLFYVLITILYFCLEYFNDMKTRNPYKQCNSSDLNPFMGCQPENCSEKYFGKRNFFEFGICHSVSSYCKSLKNMVCKN